MRVLFVLRHAGYLRNFEAVIGALASRGHQVHLGLEVERSHYDPEIADRLHAKYEDVTYGFVPRRGDAWGTFAARVRSTIDYLRYLSPLYRDSPKLRARAEKRAPRWIVGLTRLPGMSSRPVVLLLSAIARTIDRAIPSAPEIDDYVREQAPDLVLVTPLLAEPAQTEFIRSARKLGVRSALPVASWDNLTNKGLIRDAPDRVYVWNDTQRDEALTLHGIPEDDVAVVGAHSYDHWFRWSASTTREDFCTRVGLDPSRPFVLYVCSSSFVCPDERPIVDRWVVALRAQLGSSRLREAGVLVRPHPSAGRLWDDNPLVDRDNVAVWPPAGADPRSGPTRNDYYDSLHHCAAVVGVNTTALIEAAIVGRRSFSFRLPELFGGQEGTIHFHYLRRENGGPLTHSASLEEHFQALESELAGEPTNGDGSEWSRPFLESFVRPQGLGVDAAPLLADDLEGLAAARTDPVPSPRHHAMLRVLLYPLALGSARRAKALKQAKAIAKRAKQAGVRRQGSKQKKRGAKRIGDGKGALAVEAQALVDHDLALGAAEDITTKSTERRRKGRKRLYRRTRRVVYRTAHHVLPAGARAVIRGLRGRPDPTLERPARAAERKARVPEPREPVTARRDPEKRKLSRRG